MQILLLMLLIGVMNLCLGCWLGIAWWRAGCRATTEGGPPADAVEEPFSFDRCRQDTEQCLVALGEVDSRLQAGGEAADASLVQGCVYEVQELCESQRQELSAVPNLARERLAEAAANAAEVEGLESAVCNYMAQIETTINNLAIFDSTTDVPTAVKRLSAEIHRLETASRSLLERL